MASLVIVELATGQFCFDDSVLLIGVEAVMHTHHLLTSLPQHPLEFKGSIDAPGSLNSPLGF